MDVHPPHQPVHGWRDFFTHLVIVTIGLFIALMMEAGVEALHHRHIVREARENIRTELEHNHASTVENVAELTRNLARMEANIRTLNLLRKKDTKGAISLSYTMTFNDPSDAAWRTARDTGALAYMPYAEVQGYADVYEAQAELNQQASAVGQHEFALLAPTQMGIDFKDLSPADFDTMLHGSAASLLEICAFRQQVEELDQDYLTQLGNKGETANIDSCGNLMQSPSP